MRDFGGRSVRIAAGALASMVVLTASSGMGFSQSGQLPPIPRLAPIPSPPVLQPPHVIIPAPAPRTPAIPSSRSAQPAPPSAAVDNTGGAPAPSPHFRIPNEIWSQTANTTGGGGASGGGKGCSCPAIKPLATSDKPASGRVYEELDLIDLEHFLSDREARYGGDWDKALLALAHDIDPSGAQHLWSAPMPAPSNAQAPVTEGTLSASLLYGTIASAKAAGHAVYTGDFDAAQGIGRIVQTVARINKFGEPTFGLRKALFAVARFLLDDLASVATPGPRAAHTAEEARNALAAALRPVDARRIPANSPRNNFAKVDLEESTSDRFEGKPKATLEVDDYDRANAALDILMSVDDHDQIVGLVTYSSVRDPEELVTQLIGIASWRASFGGPAAANSPEDAIGCKAFAVLAALLDYHRKYSPHWREFVWRDFNEIGLRYQEKFTQPVDPRFRYRNDKPAFLAARSALVIGGLRDADQARKEADELVSGSIDWSLRPDSQAFLHMEVPLIDASIRDIETLSAGPAQAAFADFVDKKWAQLHANLEEMTKRGDYYDREPAIKNWDASHADMDRVTLGKLCPLPATPPRVLLLAKGVLHDFVVDKFYVGVPMAVEVTFDEPYAGDSYPIEIDLGGGKVDLSATPVDTQRRVFETEHFVPTQ